MFNRKKHDKKYHQSEKYKKYQKKYHQSKHGRLVTRLAKQKYRKTNSGRLRAMSVQKKYATSKKGILTRKIWLRSKKGFIYTKKRNDFYGPIHVLKRYHNIVMENCAICGELKTEFHHPNPFLPLHVYFLCKSCHKKQHEKRK